MNYKVILPFAKGAVNNDGTIEFLGKVSRRKLLLRNSHQVPARSNSDFQFQRVAYSNMRVYYFCHFPTAFC